MASKFVSLPSTIEAKRRSELRKFDCGGFCWKMGLLVLLGGGSFLIGCKGFPATIPISGPLPPTTPLAPTVNSAVTAKEIYSINLQDQTVDVYVANLNGTVSPNSSYAGGALAVTGDADGNIYIGTYSATKAAVQVYGPAMSTVTRSIIVATATVNAPQITALAVDSASNVYVAISNSIYVYGPTATGAATPVRTISGPLTLLSQTATQMAFDANDNLFVAVGGGYKGSQVIEFAVGALGNVAPTVITSPDYFPSGVAIDKVGDIYVVQGGSSSAGDGTYEPAINVFSKGSVAGATPKRVIAGSKIGIAIFTTDIFVDSGANIFVGAVLNGQVDFLVYSATAEGNVGPASTLVRSKGSTTDSQFFVK